MSACCGTNIGGRGQCRWTPRVRRRTRSFRHGTFASFSPRLATSARSGASSRLSKPNGQPYLSGTEWEYEDAASAEPPPDILLYRRTERPRIDIDDPELDEKKRQYGLVSAFLARFRNPDGSLAGSVTDYPAPEALAQRLVSDLTGLLSRRIGFADAAAADRLAALERIADEAIAAKQALERQVGELREQQALKDDIIRSLNAAVEALAAQARDRQEVAGIETALQHLAANKVSDAVAIFEEVVDRKEAEGKHKEAASRKAFGEAAAAARHLGALLSLQDTQGALAAYRRAAELEPEDVWTWIAVADLEVQGGTLARAKEAAERALAVALSTDNPRDLSVSHNKIGDVLVAQGDLAAALASYRAPLGIRERLAAADPGNAGWQRDLAWSHWRLARHGEQPHLHWHEVVRILKRLEREGRLAPADQKWLPIAEKNLAAAESAGTGDK